MVFRQVIVNQFWFSNRLDPSYCCFEVLCIIRIDPLRSFLSCHKTFEYFYVTLLSSGCQTILYVRLWSNCKWSIRFKFVLVNLSFLYESSAPQNPIQSLGINGAHLFCLVIFDLVWSCIFHGMESATSIACLCNTLLVFSASLFSTFFESLSLLNSITSVTSANVPSHPFFPQAMIFSVQILDNHK